MGRRGFTGGANFAEKLFEGIATDDMGVCAEARLAECFLEKLCHVKPDSQEFALFFLCCKFVFKSGRKHVGKQLEGDWEEEFHEGDDDEDGKGDETEEILGCASKLTAFAASEGLPMENFPLQTGRDTHFRDEQLRAMPVMLSLVLDFFPHTSTEGSRRAWLAVVCGLEATLEGSTRRNTVARRGTKIRRNTITRGNTITRRSTKTRQNTETRMTRKTSNPSTGQHHFCFLIYDFLILLLSLLLFVHHVHPFQSCRKKIQGQVFAF